ncbi:unnamed protein product [Prunus brigantina]
MPNFVKYRVRLVRKWPWLVAKKYFNHDQCWEVVKNCLRFGIISTGPTVVLN